MGDSKQVMALQALDMRLRRWEAMCTEEIGAEFDAIDQESYLAMKGEFARSADGKIIDIRGTLTASLKLRCIDGLRPGPMTDWDKINRLLDRVTKQRARASEARRVVGYFEAATRRDRTKSADTRWARLDPVKEWAFEQRRNNPKPSRAQVIKDIKDEVRARAKKADEPLSGDDLAVIRTITKWFRLAGIK